MINTNTEGAIINMSSLAALRNPENMLAYNASKNGVISLTKTSAKELGKYLDYSPTFFFMNSRLLKDFANRFSCYLNKTQKF